METGTRGTGARMPGRVIEVFYNPASCDWDAAADAALEGIDYIPSVILCYPREEARQLKLFKDSDNGQKRN